MYSPLDHSTQEIRVLTLETTTDKQQPIRCKLSPQSLDCSKSSFVAFSYVWGANRGRKMIYVNELPIQITRNLYKLLRAVQNPATAPLQLRYLWIDAICINQEDGAERAIQVQLMRRIYREARFVVAWLGRPSDDSRLAFKVLEIAADERAAGTRLESTSWLYKNKDLLCNFEETPMSVSSDSPSQQSNGTSNAKPPYNSAWRSIFNLMRRPYFKRLWTFQEAVLPCTLFLLCGSEVSPLDNLLWLLNWVMNCDLYSCPPFMDTNVWSILTDKRYVTLYIGFKPLDRIYKARKHCHGSRNIQNIASCRCQGSNLHLNESPEEEDLENRNQHSLSLWDIATITISLRSNDPRDKVYGILGLGECNIIPDYTKSIREVLTEFAYVGLQDDLNRVIELSRWVDREAQPDHPDPELPSWVPPLSARSGRHTVSSTSPQFNASELRYMDGKTWPRNWVRPWANGDILHVQGLLCEQVSRVGDVISYSNIFSMVSQYVQEQEFDVSYITRIPRFQAILRVLIQDEDFESQQPLIPGDGALQRHAWAFLSWLLLEQDETDQEQDKIDKEQDEINKEQFLHKLGLHGLLDDEYRDALFQAQILGDAKDGENMVEGLSIDEALDPTQELWMPMQAKMSSNKEHRLFQTEDGYLGIGPRTMRPGDSISVLFGCRNPVVLRATGSYHHNIGPCFILGLMEGEAIRDMVNGSKVAREFQIC